jgi:hypothetical protein
MKGLTDAFLKMWVITNGTTSGNGIQTAFVNLVTLPGSNLRKNTGGDFACSVLLENPVGENRITYEQLAQEVNIQSCFLSLSVCSIPFYAYPFLLSSLSLRSFHRPLLC